MWGLSWPSPEINLRDRKRFRIFPVATALPIAGLSLGLFRSWPVLAVGLVLCMAMLAARQKQPAGKLVGWLGRLLPLLVLITFAILLISDYI
jgi:hypothetical protein